MPAERTKQQFGGDWTEDKLGCVENYLKAYLTALKNQPFKLVYVDAFAGTGYSELKETPNASEPLFPELIEQESARFIEGSARRALKLRPAFDRYVLIEKGKRRFAELTKLKTEFPDIADRIEPVNDDANAYLQRLAKENWKSQRAVVFLDPFGMQVQWDTLTSLAKTQAFDTWILFPLGMAVNRLLQTDKAKIPPAWRKRLELSLPPGWEKAFYAPSGQLSFVESDPELRRIASIDAIGKFFLDSLKAAFAKTAPTPRVLKNSQGVPLYLLCFAAANPKGAPTAVRIAKHILEMP